jgi:tetratricopeptide (TPR) repeat protein
MRSNYMEASRWLRAALDLHAQRSIPGPSDWLAKALLGAARFNLNQDKSAGLSRLETASEIYTALRDQSGIAYSQYLLGSQFLWPPDFSRAYSHFETALDLWTVAEDGWGIGICLYAMGHIAEAMGERAKAQEFLQRSLEVLREVGDRSQQLWPLQSLSRQAWIEGNIPRAKLLLDERRAIGMQLNSNYSDWYTLHSLATMLTQQGRYAEAIEVIHMLELNINSDDGTPMALLGEVAYLQGQFEEATRLYEMAYDGWGAENDRHGQGWSLARMGCIAYRLGDLDRSARLLEQSLEFLGPRGLYWNRALVLLVQGDIARVRGQIAAAAQHYASSLKLLGSELIYVPDRLEAFARLAGAAGQPQRAARLFGAASAMRQRLSVPIPLVEQADYDAALANARAQIDPAAFSAAWAEGAALSDEEAVALALGNPES